RSTARADLGIRPGPESRGHHRDTWRGGHRRRAAAQRGPRTKRVLSVRPGAIAPIARRSFRESGRYDVRWFLTFLTEAAARERLWRGLAVEPDDLGRNA